MPNPQTSSRCKREIPQDRTPGRERLAAGLWRATGFADIFCLNGRSRGSGVAGERHLRKEEETGLGKKKNFALSQGKRQYRVLESQSQGLVGTPSGRRG